MNDLFIDKSNCCGCGACVNICPNQAVSMQTDEHGFIYPKIKNDICINCGLCKSVCGYQAEMKTLLINETFVAVAKNDDILENSSSGGVFAAMATEVISRGGVAFGCSLEYVNDKLTPKHIMIDKIEDLIKLQGSKYIQSYIGNTYILAKKELDQGRMVLFSGTPCQIDGLKHYLNMKYYDNLLTVDIICHGVPNAKMFQGYIAELEKKLKSHIVDFKFRDKSKGSSYYAKIVYIKANSKVSKYFSSSESSYYSLFLSSSICRENCYTCKYADSKRVGDFTIGDYWGIELEHPKYLENIDPNKGVSCIIVNSEHGLGMLNELCSDIELFPSKFEKAARSNVQLNHPCNKSSTRETILDIYKNEGYEAVEKWYRKSQGVNLFVKIIKRHIPPKLKLILKSFIKR